MHNPNKLVLNYKKRINMYTNSTGSCTFDPTQIEARSYKWWVFVKVVEGKVIFNNYRYSNTTSKHQSKIRALMNDLGIKIDLEIPIPEGLQSKNTRGQGQEQNVSVQDLILQAEEYLCNQIGNEVLKQQARNVKAKARRDALKATKEYHNNQFNNKAEKIINSTI